MKEQYGIDLVAALATNMSGVCLGSIHEMKRKDYLLQLITTNLITKLN